MGEKKTLDFKNLPGFCFNISTSLKALRNFVQQKKKSSARLQKSQNNEQTTSKTFLLEILAPKCIYFISSSLTFCFPLSLSFQHQGTKKRRVEIERGSSYLSNCICLSSSGERDLPDRGFILS